MNRSTLIGLIAVLAVLALGACAKDDGGESYANPEVLRRIQNAPTCAAAQAEHDIAWESWERGAFGSIAKSRSGEYMEAADARLRALGCY